MKTPHNLALRYRDYLHVENYVLKANSSNDYWFNFAKSKIADYVSEYGDDFNIIVAGSQKNEEDFYIIPFRSIKHLLKDVYLSQGDSEKSRVRWIGAIHNHALEIRNCPYSIDVSKHFGNVDLLKKLF